MKRLANTTASPNKSMLWLLGVAFIAALALSIGIAPANVQGSGAIRPGFDANAMSANDDLSTGLVPLGFTINFFGVNYTHLYINNNGNVTFDDVLPDYTPFNLTTTGRVIMAPFFADVDTTGSGSGVVTYGTGMVDGRPAFGVNWINVGYFDANTDKLNSFQLVLIDRSDIAPGDFDMEFNYDQIQWETGDLNNGTNGLGGNSARVGYSNGSGDPGTFFEFPGSGVPGSFLDSNTTTGLIHNSLNSTQLGRYVFYVRSGQVEPTPTPTVTPTPLPTNTPTATPTPTPTPPFPVYRFWGNVKDERGNPLVNVLVQLLAYHPWEKKWRILHKAYTHPDGRFYLYRQEDYLFTRYQVVVEPEQDWVAVNAEAPPPAMIIDNRTIEYEDIPAGFYQENRFTLAKITPTPTATPTPSTGVVQGFVWQDENMDGHRQEGEKGLPGVTVRLREQSSIQRLLAWETNTDDTGFYRFANIPPGVYILSIDHQIGFYPTTETIIEVKAEANTVVEADFGLYVFSDNIYMPLIWQKQALLDSTPPSSSE